MYEKIVSDFPIMIRRSLRCRKMSLRISSDYRSFIVTIPKRGTIFQAEAFIKKNEEWLYDHAQFLSKGEGFKDGCCFFFLGKEVVLKHEPKARRGVWQEGKVIYVSGGEEFLSRRVKEFLHKRFKEHIKGRIKVYSDRVKKKVNKVTIRDNTSRWGSCSSNGNVSINFFLSYAPESIIDYVVVHELCHLIEMNHSKSFWQEVENLYPDYKAARKWLREEGRRLYTFL